MAMFNFQLSWNKNRQLVLLNMLHFSNKSSGTTCLSVNFSTFLVALADLILYTVCHIIDQIVQNFYFFSIYILSLFPTPQVRTLIVKLRLLPRKTSFSGISLTFFLIFFLSIENVSNKDCPIL